MTYRILVILAVLLALPFSLKVRAQDYDAVTIINSELTDSIVDDSDTTHWQFDVLLDSIRVDGGWLVHHGPDTVHFHKSPLLDTGFVVYYIDTVGCDPHHENRFEGDAMYSITVWTPIIDTIIVARFWTDSTKRIKDWRVMGVK